MRSKRKNCNDCSREAKNLHFSYPPGGLGRTPRTRKRGSNLMYGRDIFLLQFVYPWWADGSSVAGSLSDQTDLNQTTTGASIFLS